jgi:ArsR family transcriptional regulator
MNEQELSQATAVFKALSDPNRLRIFAELMSGDSCNCELKDNLGLASNLLSHHLKVLESVGLIQSRRDVVDGRWIYYSVNQAAAAHWRSWFNHFLDPTHIQERLVCGPERDLIMASQVAGPE